MQKAYQTIGVMAAIYLIRHGQASLGFTNYDELSEAGARQARVVGKELAQRGIIFHKVFSGTMQRHRQTAVHCLQAMNLQCSILFNSCWNEFDHMDIIAKYEPRYRDIHAMVTDISSSENPKQKIMEMLAAALQRWADGKHQDYNESWADFCQRVDDGMQQLLNQLGRKENALVFTSGGVICAIMKRLLDLTPQKTFELQLSLANASISHFKNSSRGFHLISFNDHAHFQKEHKGLLTLR